MDPFEGTIGLIRELDLNSIRKIQMMKAKKSEWMQKWKVDLYQSPVPTRRRNLFSQTTPDEDVKYAGKEGIIK